MLSLFNVLCVVVQMLDPSFVGEQVILDCYRLFFSPFCALTLTTTRADSHALGWNNTVTHEPMPVPVQISTANGLNYTDLAAGDNFTCAIAYGTQTTNSHYVLNCTVGLTVPIWGVARWYCVVLGKIRLWGQWGWNHQRQRYPHSGASAPWDEQNHCRPNLGLCSSFWLAQSPFATFLPYNGALLRYPTSEGSMWCWGDGTLSRFLKSA